MKINKLTASFGKLRNETISFSDGLNVIYAPNESGKSTWCAFIRAMLYGVESSQRSRAGFMPDKLRYAPWTGESMEGTMELTADGRDITLTRKTKLKTAPMREFSAVYTGTNVKVEGLTGPGAGEALTGVTRDVFTRSAFVGQGDVAVAGNAELEKRIASIVSSGDEATSFSDAESSLKKWQHRRRYNRSGMLPELESRIEENRRLSDELDGSGQSIAQLEKQLESARADCVRLEAEVTESRRRQRRESLDILSRGRSEAEAAEKKHEDALYALENVQRERSAHRFAELSADEAEDTVGIELAELTRLAAASVYKAAPLMPVLFFVLCAVFAGLFVYFKNVAYIAVAAVLLVCAIVFVLRGLRARKRAYAAAAERSRRLGEYSVEDEFQLKAELEAYLALCEKEQDAAAAEELAAQSAEKCRIRQKRIEDEALSDLDFASGSSPAARLGRELNARRAQAERLSSQLSSLKGRLSAMGDLMVVKSDLEYMQEQHAAIQEEYDAITLALDTLRDADSELQSRFSPALGKKASEYMSYLTGGRYEGIFINRDFSAATRLENDSVRRDSGFLSAGTLDLMYLSVRLAVCALALPEGKSCPLIIDDALVNLDEERLARVMALLGEIAKERQVILFTCRNR